MLVKTVEGAKVDELGSLGLLDHVKVVLANVAPFARHNVTILQKATIN